MIDSFDFLFCVGKLFPDRNRLSISYFFFISFFLLIFLFECWLDYNGFLVFGNNFCTLSWAFLLIFRNLLLIIDSILEIFLFLLMESLILFLAIFIFNPALFRIAFCHILHYRIPNWSRCLRNYILFLWNWLANFIFSLKWLLIRSQGLFSIVGF